jgi:hypothetical protein
LIRANSWNSWRFLLIFGHEFHEFHEKRSKDHLTVAPENLTRASNCTHRRRRSRTLAEPIDDAGIPTLAAVLDPVELRKSLAPVLPAEWGETGDVRVKVLKHHRGKRCTVEIGLETTHGFRELIGKVYSKDRSYVYDFMDSLRRRNFDGEDEFSIPRPFAFLKPLRLLLQEKVQGPRAQEVFLTAGDRERGAAAERCARWLARFHALAPTTGPVFAFSDHMRKM